MYAPPHLIKKCVILCIRGLLYFVNSSVRPTSPDAPFQNIIQHPGVTKVFLMVLQKFHVGLWSSMTKLKLFPLLRHILSAAILNSLSFIFSKEECHDFMKYPLCYKMCDTLFQNTTSRAVCAKNQILFVDVCFFTLRHNPDVICYHLYPFVEEFRYPNKSRIISNVATDINHLFILCIRLSLFQSI